MKWLTLILAMLLLVGCRRNEVFFEPEPFYPDPNSAIFYPVPESELCPEQWGFYPLDPWSDQWDITVRTSKIPLDPGLPPLDPWSDQWDITVSTSKIPLDPGLPPLDPTPWSEPQPPKDEQVQIDVPDAEKNCNPNDQFRSVKDSQVPDAPRRKFRWHVDPSRKDADGNFIRVRIYEDEEK